MLIARRIVQISQEYDLITLILDLNFTHNQLQERAIIQRLDGTSTIFDKITSKNPNFRFAWNNERIEKVDDNYGCTFNTLHYDTFANSNSVFPSNLFDAQKSSIAIGSTIYPLGEDKYFVISKPQESVFNQRAGYLVVLRNGAADVHYFQTIDSIKAGNISTSSSFYINGNNIFVKKTVSQDSRTAEVVEGVLDINLGIKYIPSLAESDKMLQDRGYEEIVGTPILEYVKQKEISMGKYFVKI